MNQRESLKCVKCHQSAETEANLNEFTHTYPIRDKDGQIYCWYCYKSISHCKGCGKSVANLKFPRSGNPIYPHCSGYSIGCERIENKVEFICSKECAENLAKQKCQAWKDKLNKGWTKCARCVEFWIDKQSNEKGWEWLKEESQHSRFIKLLPPSEKGVCDSCKPYEKDGYYTKIRQKAQKYWDSLNQEARLEAIERTDGVHMAKWYGKDLTTEQLAAQKTVPRSIYEEFVHKQKCAGCDEEPCREQKKNNNPLRSNNLSATSTVAKPNDSSTANQQLTQILSAIQNLEQKIAELEKNGNNSSQVQALKQEVKVLEKQKQLNSAGSKQDQEADTKKTNSPVNNQTADNFTQPNKRYTLLMAGGLLVVGAALVIGYLLGKDKNKR